MSNTKKNHWRDRAQIALKTLLEHSIGFGMLCITHIAIFHPSRLNNPLFLIASIAAFLYALATPTNNFGQADAINAYRNKLLETTPEKERSNLMRFQLLQNFLMYSANILQMGLICAIVLTPTSTTPVIIATYLSYFAVSCLRDYLTQEYTLEFLAPFFTTLNFAPGRDCTVSAEDNLDLHLTQQSLQEETLKRFQIGCQLDQIIKPDALDSKKSPGALLHPNLLVHKESKQKLWVERGPAVKKIHQIERDYLYYDHHFPVVQEKIAQIRKIIEDTLRQYDKMRSLYTLLDDLYHDKNFNNYVHAIAQTADIELPANHSKTRVRELADHPVMVLLDEQYGQVKKAIRERNFFTTTDSKARTEIPTCQIISFGAAVSPLEITFTHKDKVYTPSKDKDVESAPTAYVDKVDHMIVDAKNLLSFMNTCPTEKSFSARIASDIKLLDHLSQTPEYYSSSKATHGQVQHIKSLAACAYEYCNPIAFAIMAYGNNCRDVLHLMLTHSQLRSRLLDDDLLQTLRTKEKSLWDYLDQEKLSDIKHRIIDQCFTYNAHDGMLDSAPIFSTQKTDDLFKKRWPSIQHLMIGPDSNIRMAFNLTIMDKLHEHAKAVTALKLIPRAYASTQRIEQLREYYVTTDKGFRKCSGRELDIPTLTKFCLFSSGAVVSTTPQPQKPSSRDNASIIFSCNDGRRPSSAGSI